MITRGVSNPAPMVRVCDMMTKTQVLDGVHVSMRPAEWYTRHLNPHHSFRAELGALTQVVQFFGIRR